MVNPDEVKNHITHQMRERGAEELGDLIREFIEVHKPSLPLLEKAEKAEQLSPAVKFALEQYHEQCRERRVIPSFEWSDHHSRRLLGSQFLWEQRGQEQHRNLPLAAELRECLYEDLSPEEFEILCSKLISSLDGFRAFATRRTKDKGIDFLGEFSLGRKLGGPAWRMLGDISLIIPGQAKQHTITNSVGVKDLREFVGAVELSLEVCLEEYKDEEKIAQRALNSLYRASIHPVLVTTGTFTPAAQVEARRHKTVLVDGEQLSQVAALLNIGIIHGDETRFNAELLRSFL